MVQRTSLAFPLLVLLGTFSFCSGATVTHSDDINISVAGKTFVGKPVDPPYSTDEGGAEPGTFSFVKDRTITFFWRGDDIEQMGTWEQDGNEVVITDEDGPSYVFVLKNDGRELHHTGSNLVLYEKLD